MNRLHEVLQSGITTFSLSLCIVLGLLGLASILFGKKIYWLPFAINAFLISYTAIHLMVNWGDKNEFLTAIGISVLAGVLSIPLKKMAIAVNAFFIIGLLVGGLINLLVGFENNSFMPLIIFFTVGSVAAFFTFSKVQAGLSLTTAVIGGLALVIGGFKIFPFAPNPMLLFLVWLALGLAGTIFQENYLVIKKKPSLE